MSGRDWPARLAMGASAGFAGTFLLQVLRMVTAKAAPQTLPPMKQDPGEYMVDRAEALLPDGVRSGVPEGVENAAGMTLGMGYGMTFGALYAALRPEDPDPFLGGATLGLGCWAAGYLGWLPGLGLMPPVDEQRPEQVAGPILSHVAYGVATVAAYRWLFGRGEGKDR